MEWWVVIMLVIVVAVIFFPAAYVWNLNIGGIYAAVKHARERREIRVKEASDMKTSQQGNYQRGEMTLVRRVAFAALFFLVAILFPILILVALFVAIREPLLRSLRRAAYAALFFLAGISTPVLVWVGLVVAMRKPLLQALRRVAYAGLMMWAAFAFAIRKLLLTDIGRLTLAWQQVATSRRAIRPVAYASLLFFMAILVPVLIWIAFAVVARELSLRWRESRLPSALICRLDSDCPPGYVCVAGRCVPQY